MAQRSYSLGKLAAIVGGEVSGDEDIEITGVGGLDDAGGQDITFVARERDLPGLNRTRAAAAVVPATGEIDAPLPVIRVADPYLAIARIHTLLLKTDFVARGVHDSAVIGPGCHLPEAVDIAAGCVLGAGVRLGERVRLHPGVKIAEEVVIGDDCEIHANVVIARGTVIGNRVVVHAGAVIGSDGFGYAFDPKNGTHVKRPQVGTVRLEDDVEIGANTTVDRAAFGTTVIGAGTKIDNLVQIGHNVRIGPNSIVVAQTGISGSTTLGRNVVLGGQAGISGHLHLDDGVMVGAKSGVHNDVPAGTVVSGYPAIDHRKWLRLSALVQKLPDLIRDVRALKKKMK